MIPYATGMRWGEGPRWHQGSLWLSDTQGSKLWHGSPDTWTSVETPSVSNGLWFLPDGTLVAAMMHERRLCTWTGTDWETFIDLTDIALGPLGDLVGDLAGNLYVDDLGFAAHAGEAPKPGRIILVKSNGSAYIATNEVEFPNGLAIIDGGRTLVVAETAAQCLSAFTISEDGTLTDKRLYADIAALAGKDARPDGIWPVAKGIWVATTSGQAVVLIHDGLLADRIEIPQGFPIACCTTADGRLIVTVAETDGQPLHEALAQKTVTTTAYISSI